MGQYIAMKNGLYMGQPSPNEVSNFSPFFTLPINNNENQSSELQLHSEEQAKNRKLSAEDLTIVINQKIHYPESYNTLRHFIRNIIYMILAITGLGSLLITSMQACLKHVYCHEIEYIYIYISFQ